MNRADRIGELELVLPKKICHVAKNRHKNKIAALNRGRKYMESIALRLLHKE